MRVAKEYVSCETLRLDSLRQLLQIQLLLERLDRYFLEENDVVITVILQAHVAEVGPRTALRLEIELARGHRIAVLVVGDFHAVQSHDRARSIQRDVHGVPLRPRLPRMRNQ